MINVKEFCAKQVAYNEMIGFECALEQQKTFALFSEEEAAKLPEYQARFDAAKARHDAL